MLVVFVAAIVIACGNANADFTFGEPTNLGPTINTSSEDGPGCFSSDDLEMYLDSDRPGGYGSWDLYVATRPTTSDPWGAPVNLGEPVNTSAGEMTPSLSGDGLLLFFHSNRPGGPGGVDLWVSKRPTTQDPWGEPGNLDQPVNSSNYEFFSSISTDGLELYFCSNRPGGYGGRDLWVTTRATTDANWGPPLNLRSPVNSSYLEQTPTISADGVVLFFSSNRPGGFGGTDLWVATRATVSEPWAEAVNLGPTVNTSAGETCAIISRDGSTLYFCSTRPGGLGDWDIYQAPIIPIVDFNGDGIVDAADICIMVDHWGTDEPLCDIGPTPLGDGIVDVQDLIVLAEHLFKDVNDPTLVAHWALDEIEGDIASDSANDNDGTVYGDPAWQPEGGIVDGALQLDGIDDYVNTPFVLNPADGKFSVFVWIKGGAPGQAVLSQIGGVNWLCADTLEGNLMTELKATSRGAAALLSQTVITDGNWHRIGLVWDGSHRTLYVDDVAVAEDAQTNLEGSDNGLYIGTGKAMEAGTYWSGLIDDVRIYNRAVRP